MRTAFHHLAAAAVLFGLAACSIEEDNFRPEPDGEGAGLITISGEISQVYQTRANDTGFADKDQIGVYIVDYDGSKAGTLKNSGNRADNVKFTFDEAAYKWNSNRDIYWKDKETHIDVYGYYPYSSSVDKVSVYPFEVQKDQSTEALNGKLGGYETSDFLWGKAENAAPMDRIVRLSFSHRMAGVRVSLIKGTGFSDAEWSEASKEVLILNTKRKAMIDLSTGVVTASGEADGTGIIPYKKGKDFRAVVVPQEIAEGTPIINVTVDGISYKFNRGLVFAPSKQHNFTITVNKKALGDFEFKLGDESITAWENDDVSHDATTREYIVINVETPGTLDKCVEDAGLSLKEIKNLKLTGKINSRDFAVIRYLMTSVRALNLKEVRIFGSSNGGELNNISEYGYDGGGDDMLPNNALYKMDFLHHLILPEKLVTIGSYALGKTNITGSFIIPEGVISIYDNAFEECRSIGNVSFPSSLIEIRAGAFVSSSISGVLSLPNNLENIGESAFANCDLLQEVRLPTSLKSIGEWAFNLCTNLSGSISFPANIKEIPKYLFRGCSKLDGTLTLPDGIIKVGDEAFNSCKFKGELVLPKELMLIEDSAFKGCRFSDRLSLPKNLIKIGRNAFAGNQKLSGIIEIPESVAGIGSGAFTGCINLKGIIIPKSIGNIPNGAFSDCLDLNKIVCKAEFPPEVASDAFAGVPKDNFTVEVPESAVAQYQTAKGWNEFKRISAYRNLAVRPSAATALNTKTTRELILNADDEWEVESMPGWVTLSQKEGKGKTLLKLEFLQMPKGKSREGKIVFKLKGKDYRTTCNLTQYDCDYAEDEIITLRKADKGNGINLVFLGDGFSAKDISEGQLMNTVQEAVGHFFSIEPYKTYKEYFNVYTGIAVSPESGIGGVNTIIYNKFNTSAKGGATLGGRYGESDYNEIFKYACKAPTVNEGNLNQTLIVIVPNTTDYGGICYMYDGGEAIAYCPMSDYGYPLDFRGVVQHEAGGHGFGKLGDEYIYINAFIDDVGEFNNAKMKGWYENLSLSGKMSEVPWSHLIFDEKYSRFVDIFEGGFKYTRGVYRSEYNSCMNNDIPYYSTISREAIVKRIMEYAGKEYSFEKFVANDIIDAQPESASATTKASPFTFSASGGAHQNGPVFMGKRPVIK